MRSKKNQVLFSTWFIAVDLNQLQGNFQKILWKSIIESILQIKRYSPQKLSRKKAANPGRPFYIALKPQVK